MNALEQNRSLPITSDFTPYQVHYVNETKQVRPVRRYQNQDYLHTFQPTRTVC